MQLDCTDQKYSSYQCIKILNRVCVCVCVLGRRELAWPLKREQSWAMTSHSSPIITFSMHMYCLMSMTTARCRRCWKTQNRKCHKICFPAVANSRKAEQNIAHSFPFITLLLHYVLLATLMKLARAWSRCLHSCIRGRACVHQSRYGFGSFIPC